MRTTLVVLGLLAIAACNGGGETGSDGGADAGPPAGWTCPARDYADGMVCHCDCGIPDPDCTDPNRIVSGCVNNQVCTPAGTCSDCGDGEVEAGEQCDVALPAKAECGPMGYQPGQVPCKAGCTWAYDQCQPLLTCANGMLDPGELCDGTAIQAGLDCTDYQRTSGTLTCKTGCSIDSSGCYTCGDGKKEGPEACDDHDTSGGDGCSATCTVEAGYTCTGTTPSVCTPTCGDGVIIGGEMCDDHNTNSNDGCSATCHVEQDCSCSGSPSVCSCATVQTIATQTGYTYFDTASIVLDATNQPKVSYYYGLDYTDPVTNYSMEHGHLEYAERPATTWQSSEIQTWDVIRTTLGPNDIVMANDGGMIRVFFNRIYNTLGTFAVATLVGTAWQFVYDNPYYAYDVVRGGGNWHAIVSPQNFGGQHYYAGGPGAWTTDDTLTGFNQSYALRVGAATNGDVFITSFTPGTNHTSYDMKLSKRVNATTWSTEYDVTTSGTCVYPISHEILPLPGGGVVVFEDGFSGTQRWLRAHRFNGTSWVVEDVADLSFTSNTCSANGTSYSGIHKVMAVDALGQPHILFASAPSLSSLTLEDHYRDGTGWHVRKTPLSGAAPLAMIIDANNATHILAVVPGGASGASKLDYLRISAGAWQ